MACVVPHHNPLYSREESRIPAGTSTERITQLHLHNSVCHFMCNVTILGACRGVLGDCSCELKIGSEGLDCGAARTLKRKQMTDHANVEDIGPQSSKERGRRASPEPPQPEQHHRQCFPQSFNYLTEIPRKLS